MTLTSIKIQFVIPAERTNYVTNPEFGVATTGYTALAGGSAIARVTTQMRRGIACCRVTPPSGAVGGMYFAIALTSGVQYSFSADILDVAGQTFNLFIASNTGGTAASTVTSWVGTGYWKRRSVTWTATSSATFYLFLTRSSVASTTVFYTDGWQLEVGAVSTFFDGNSIGNRGEIAPYRWNGTPNASTSWRSGQTRSGGTTVDLSTYATWLALIGLGMNTIFNIAVPSSRGGSFYQDSIAGDRPFSIVMQIEGGGDYAVTQRAKAALINAVKPDVVTQRQPLLIQYDQFDANGLEISETLMIPAVYEGGLEMDGQGDNFLEKISLNFKTYLPYIQQQGENGVTLGYQTSVADVAYLAKRSTSGIWSNVSASIDSDVDSLALGTDGGIFVGGEFSTVGVSNTSGIAKWDGTAFTALGTGISTAAVYVLRVDAAGNLYAGGLFNNAGGVAAADNIGKWDGSNWSGLGSGTGGAVYAIAIASDTVVYAGGAFTNLTDANGDYISMWNGSAWSSLGTGMNNEVRCLTIGPDGYLYAGGSFSLAGGVSGTSGVARWNGSAWQPLGTGISVAAGKVVRALEFGPDGKLYAGGTFVSAGGITVGGIAAWDGTTWSKVGGVGIAGGTGAIYNIKFDANGILYAGGDFTTIDGITLPDSIASWNGSSWSPIDVDLPGSSVWDMLFDRSGNFYVGASGTGTATSAIVTTPSIGSAATYPTVIFYGPGTLYQLKNYTTGKSIFFDLTLLSGEWAILYLDPQNIRFVSSFRGNILSTILPGSNLDWELLPGSNNVSAFMYGSTGAATTIQMVWKNQYWSIDGAVR